MNPKPTLSHIVLSMTGAVRARWRAIEADIASRRTAARDALRKLSASRPDKRSTPPDKEQ